MKELEEALRGIYEELENLHENLNSNDFQESNKNLLAKKEHAEKAWLSKKTQELLSTQNNQKDSNSND